MWDSPPCWAGFLYLGAVPPKPHVQEMHVVLPNSRFGDEPGH